MAPPPGLAFCCSLSAYLPPHVLCTPLLVMHVCCCLPKAVCVMRCRSLSLAHSAELSASVQPPRVLGSPRYRGGEVPSAAVFATPQVRAKGWAVAAGAGGGEFERVVPAMPCVRHAGMLLPDMDEAKRSQGGGNGRAAK